MCAASKCSEMVKRDKVEPMYLRDYERKQLLERGAMAGVSDSEEEEEKRGRGRRGGGEEERGGEEEERRKIGR